MQGKWVKVSSLVATWCVEVQLQFLLRPVVWNGSWRGLNLLFEFLQLVSIEQLIPSYVYQNLNTSIKLEQRL